MGSSTAVDQRTRASISSACRITASAKVISPEGLFAHLTPTFDLHMAQKPDVACGRLGEADAIKEKIKALAARCAKITLGCKIVFVRYQS